MNSQDNGPPHTDGDRTRNLQEALLKFLDYLVRNLPPELREILDESDDQQSPEQDDDCADGGKADIRLLAVEFSKSRIPTIHESPFDIIRSIRAKLKVHAS